MDFKTKTITRDKEGHYKMIKGSIQEEDITFVNVYAPKIGGPQYIRQMTIPLLGIYPGKNIIQRDTCTPMFIAALFTIASS